MMNGHTTRLGDVHFEYLKGHRENLQRLLCAKKTQSARIETDLWNRGR